MYIRLHGKHTSQRWRHHGNGSLEAAGDCFTSCSRFRQQLSTRLSIRILFSPCMFLPVIAMNWFSFRMEISTKGIYSCLCVLSFGLFGMLLAASLFALPVDGSVKVSNANTLESAYGLGNQTRWEPFADLIFKFPQRQIQTEVANYLQEWCYFIN